MPIYKTDKKKDGIYQYHVFVSYLDAQGKYRKKSARVYGKEEAKAAEHQLLQECQQSSNGGMTVQGLFDEYIAAKKSEIRQTSLDKARRNLELYILPPLGSTRLDKLTPAKLQKWKTEMADKGLAFKTLQGRYKDFHALLNYAKKCGYISENVLDRVGNFRNAYQTPSSGTLHYYTVQQWELFDAASRAAAEQRNDLTAWGMYTFFNLAFYTGMRKGEINALRWSDIEPGVIHVRRSISQKVKGDDVETPPKNKSSYRDIQIPEPLQQVLDEQKARCSGYMLFSDEWRVCGIAQDPLRDTSIEKWNTACAAAAGLPHIRIHDFRHSHASLLCNAGINIQEIARRLGHSNVTMTWNVYSHLYPAEEEKALSVLNAIKKDPPQKR